MSVRDLRLYLRSQKIPSDTFLEKRDFVEAAKQTLNKTQ